MNVFFPVDRFFWRRTMWVTRLLFVFARFKYSTWQFRCVSGFGLSCFSVNETVAGSSRIVPSPSVSLSASVSENSVNHSIAANQTSVLLVTPRETLSATSSLSVTQTEIASVTQVTNSSVSMDGRISVTPTQNSSVVNNTGTRLYERQFQYFMITSSVVFIKVPAEKPPRVKR